MAEEQDQSSKTEEPTQRKLDEARRKGQVVTSQEVKHWFMLLGALGVVLAFLPYASGSLVDGFANFLAQIHRIPTDPGSLYALLQEAVADLLIILLLPLLVLIVVALAGSLIQHGPVYSTESLKPKLEKIDPIKGLKRQFSLRALMEFVKGLLKLAIVGVVAAAVIWPQMHNVETFAGLPMALALDEIWSMAAAMLIAVVAVMAVIAGADYMYQRFEYMKQQRMTKQEVKDEYKQTEGDPMVKARLRQIRMERARQRMMSSVPGADVVITNPTHYAVAMQYQPEEMTAPKLVAKGLDALALRIREVAEENDVAIVENPPLARALYKSVEIDEEIPPEHYRAVAEIISYVFRLRRRAMPAQR